MRRSLLVLALAALAGCRSCDEERAPGPPMPKGMLVPVEASAPGPDADPAFTYALRRERAGSGVEIHPAEATDTERNDVASGVPGAVYLSFEAMELLHEAFARAYAGGDPGRFDLFVPRIVGGAALAAELGALLAGLPDSDEAARMRWPKLKTGGWTTVRPALLAGGNALIQYAKAHERLWVLAS